MASSNNRNNNNNNNNDEPIPPDPRLLKRRETIYEDTLGNMVKETEESAKKLFQHNTDNRLTRIGEDEYESDEVKRKIPFQLFKKFLNKVIHEVHYTDGKTKINKDPSYVQLMTKPHQVPCIGVDKNNLDCGENVILDIDSESTKLPFFCKMMIVNQGKVHERSIPVLVRDVCIQIGESITEKYYTHKQHTPTSKGSQTLEPHAVEDPNVSFTTPRSGRHRSASWSLMEEYYSIPHYQYRGKEKPIFHRGVNTYVSMGYIVDETESLHSSFNVTPNNSNPNLTVSQAVDTDDLVDHVKYQQFTKIELMSPYSLINGNNTLNVDVGPVLQKRKRKKTNILKNKETSTNYPTSNSANTSFIFSPNSRATVTLLMPATSRDTGIQVDVDENDEEIYYVRDNWTDAGEPPIDASKATDIPIKITVTPTQTSPIPKKEEPKTPRYSVESPSFSGKLANSSSSIFDRNFGRRLRQSYYKKTTGKEPIKFDDDDIGYIHKSTGTENEYFISSSDAARFERAPLKIKTTVTNGSNGFNLQSTPNSRVKPTRDSSIYEKKSPKDRINRHHSLNRFDRNDINDDNMVTSDVLSDDDTRGSNLEALLNHYNRTSNKYKGILQETSKPSTNHSKTNSIGDGLSISTIDGGEVPDYNNSFEFETSPVTHRPHKTRYTVYEQQREQQSAYPDYSRYPLISKALKSDEGGKVVYHINSQHSSVGRVKSRSRSREQPERPHSSMFENYKVNQSLPVSERSEKYGRHSTRSFRSLNKSFDAAHHTPRRSYTKELIKPQYICDNLDCNRLTYANYNEENMSMCPYCHRKLSKVETEQRIAELLSSDTNDRQYLLDTFIIPRTRSPTSLSTSRSPSRHSRRLYKSESCYSSNLSLNTLLNEAARIKLENEIPPIPYDIRADPYYRLRHDKTLKLYKEPYNYDENLGQSFRDTAAAAAISLSTSGILLNRMNKILASADSSFY